MNTKKNERKATEKSKTVWGQGQAAYLAGLKDKRVTVVFADGKALKGTLTGVDTYDLFIKQNSGLEVMICKGSVKYLHPATGDGK